MAKAKSEEKAAPKSGASTKEPIPGSRAAETNSPRWRLRGRRSSGPVPSGCW